MTTTESKGRFFYKTNRFESIRIMNRIESIRIANWNALLVTPLARQPMSCYYYVCDLSYFDVVLCPSSSQILATPLALVIVIYAFAKSTSEKKQTKSRAFYSDSGYDAEH